MPERERIRECMKSSRQADTKNRKKVKVAKVRSRYR